MSVPTDYPKVFQSKVLCFPVESNALSSPKRVSKDSVSKGCTMFELFLLTRNEGVKKL